MDALTVAVIYFGSCIAAGLILKLAVVLWTRRREVDLADVQSEGGPHRGTRRVGLLGFWRDEGPDR